MNAKRLHIHSMPLIALGVVISGLLAVTTVPSQGLWVAATKPALKTDSVTPIPQVSLNSYDSVAVEAPGVSNQLVAPSDDIARAVSAAQAASLVVLLVK